MEKLFELHSEGRFDLLVLDTPPTRNALDFLDAPKRLTQFIEGKCAARLHEADRAGGAGRRARGHRWPSRCMKRIVGFDLIADLAEFFNAFSGMVDGFQARAKRVNSLLADPHTCFLVVCGPQGEPVDEAVYFHRKLVEAKLPFGGVIVNKVHYSAERLRARRRRACPRRLEREARRRRPRPNASPGTSSDYQALAERDAAQHRASGTASCAARRVIRVPYLDEDVHDLAGLAEINRYLFATPMSETALAAGRVGPDQPARRAVVVVVELADLPVGVLRNREEVAHARGVDPLAVADAVALRRRSTPSCPRSTETSSSQLVAVIRISSSAGTGSMMRVSCSMWVHVPHPLDRSGDGAQSRSLRKVRLRSSSGEGPRHDAPPDLRCDVRSGLGGPESPHRRSRALGALIADRPCRRLPRPVAIRVSSAAVLRSVPSSPRAASRSSRRAPSSTQAASSRPPVDRRPVHQRPLQLEGALDPAAGLDPVAGLVGDQRRGPHRQRGADRPVALEHGSQGEKVVAEALEGALAGAAHLEAGDRPGECPVGVGARLERGREARPAARRPPC